MPEARVEHAVTVASPSEYLRRAAKFEPAMRLLADHPQIRPLVLEGGLLWKRSHATALLAAAGLLAARRRPAAALLALPLLSAGPVEAAYTVLETASTLRGAVRYRTPVV